MSANYLFSYPVFTSLLATEKTTNLLDVFSLLRAPLKQLPYRKPSQVLMLTG